MSQPERGWNSGLDDHDAIALVFCIVFAVALFYSPTIYRGAYTTQDWAWQRAAYYDAQHGQVPDARWSRSSPEGHGLSPVVALMPPQVPTDTVITILLLIYASLGVMGMVFLCQLLGASLDVSLLVAALFGGCGGFASRWAVGHVYILGVYLLPLVLYAWMRRWRVVTALLLALGIFEGFSHATVETILVLGVLALAQSALQFRRAPLIDLLVVGTMIFMFAGVKLLPEIQRFGNYRAWEGTVPVPLAWCLPLLLAPERLVGAPWGPWEWNMYLGWGAGLVALGLLCSVMRLRTSGVWLLTACCFMLWGLGYGGIFLSQVPVVRSQGILARVLMTGLVVSMPAAAVGLEWVVAPLRRVAPTAVSWGLAVVGAICVGDLWWASLQWQQ